MKLPSGRYVSSSTPIYPNSNFTWGEATKNCTRPIVDLIIDGRLYSSAESIEKKIISTARSLDKLRYILGNHPLIVTSWYRPSHVNAHVGGAKYSQHQFGLAVDIKSNHRTPRQIYNAIHVNHIGGLACYSIFVHIDWRGHKARW